MLKELFGSIFGGSAAAMKSVSVNEANDAVNKGNVQFVDVRSAAEFAGGHAEKAVNLPLDRLASLSAKLDKAKPTYVICQSGMRSMRGASMLEGAGFTDVYNVSGGTIAWMAAGLKTARTR